MKTNKTFYGLVAMGPLGLLFYFLTEFVALDILDIQSNGFISNVFQSVMVFTMGIMVLTIVASVPVYILHIRKNPAVPQDERLPWILGTVFSITVTTNLYYMKYILPPLDAEEEKAATNIAPVKMALWVFGPSVTYVLGILIIMIMHSTALYGVISMFLIGFIFAAGMVVAMVRLVKLSIHARSNPRLDASARRFWLIGLWLLNGPVSLLYYFVQVRRPA